MKSVKLFFASLFFCVNKNKLLHLHKVCNGTKLCVLKQGQSVDYQHVGN